MGAEAHSKYVQVKSYVAPALAALEQLHEAMFSPKEGLVLLNVELQQDPSRRSSLRHLQWEGRASSEHKWWGVALALADVAKRVLEKNTRGGGGEGCSCCFFFFRH